MILPWLSVLSHMIQRLILATTSIWLKHKNRPSCYNSCKSRSSTEIHTFLWIRRKHCQHRQFSFFFVFFFFIKTYFWSKLLLRGPLQRFHISSWSRKKHCVIGNFDIWMSWSFDNRLLWKSKWFLALNK